MPIWSEILKELSESTKTEKSPQFDLIRRKYLSLLNQYTQRDTILYATSWTQQKEGVSPTLLSIVDEDLSGIMEVIYGLDGPELDLILHSPGGSLEATEALVSYLRSKFSHIRVIVPQIAMSAATMITCASDRIVMGKHSFLGPTDPQFLLYTPLGPRMVPAQAILEQFERAKEECADPAKMGAWMPMLSQFGPDLLIQCQNASDMSQIIVERWLSTFMFKSDPDGRAKAKNIAQILSNHNAFKSHGRHIPRDEAEKMGLIVEHLEADETLQDLSLSVFHATTHTFNGTPAVKIIENHKGRAFIKQQQIVPQPVPPQAIHLLPQSAQHKIVSPEK